MRGKLIIRLVTMLLGTIYKEDEPRADMYLPLKLLAMGFILILGAIAFATAFFLHYEYSVDCACCNHPANWYSCRNMLEKPVHQNRIQ